MLQLKIHIEENHFSSRHDPSLDNDDHIENAVTGIEVISNNDVITPSSCSECDLVLANDILLKDHITTHHISLSIKCQYCDKFSSSQEDHQAHMLTAHENMVILHNVSSQMNSILEQSKELQALRNDLNKFLTKFTDFQHAVKQDFFVLKNSLMPSPTSQNKTPQVNTVSASQNITDQNGSDQVSQQTSNIGTPHPLPENNIVIESTGILYISDSVGINVQTDALEEATNDKVTTFKADF